MESPGASEADSQPQELSTTLADLASTADRLLEAVRQFNLPE